MPWRARSQTNCLRCCKAASPSRSPRSGVAEQHGLRGVLPLCSARLHQRGLNSSCEPALPDLLLLRRQQHRDDLLLAQHLDGAGRIVRHVAARRQPAELGEELLASWLIMKFAASRAAFGFGAIALTPTWPNISATGSSAQTSIGAAGELHVIRQVDVVVERDRVFAGAGGARHREMAVGEDRLERRDDVLDDLRRLLLAVVLEHRLEPFVVGAVDGDLAGPLLAARRTPRRSSAARTPCTSLVL